MKNPFGRKGTIEYNVYRQTGVDPLPRRAYVTLPYAQEVNIVVAGSVVVASKNTWRLNSPFDPDQTGTGHQPLWYDQFTPVYNNYQVIWCKWKATYMIDGASYPGCPMYALANLVTDTNAGTNGTIAGVTSSVALERPEVLCKPLPFVGQGRGTVTLYGHADIAKSFGIPKEKYLGDPNFQSVYNTNPNRGLYLETGVVCNGTGADSTFDCNIVVELQMHIMFWGWQVPTQS